MTTAPTASLRLDANEGSRPDLSVLGVAAAFDADTLRTYPSARSLECLLAERVGVHADRVLVTAGADEALDRVLRSVAGPGGRVVAPTPSFSMIPRYARLAGATLRTFAWRSGSLPIDAVVAACAPRVDVLIVVTPNNPTGSVARLDAIVALRERVPEALLVVDLAYVEYADRDPTAALLRLPRTLMLRTLSKAWGLAGLRVGYPLGQPSMIAALRCAGGPFSVAGPSLALAATRLRTGVADVAQHVARVCRERAELRDVIATLGMRAPESQANFVLATLPDAPRVARALAARGIHVRSFDGDDGPRDALRISCPGDARDFARLVAALREVSA